MTLEILEDTFLDLGPEYWAFAIVVALFIIELFQLGPHSIWFLSNKKQKKDDKIMDTSVGVAKPGKDIIPDIIPPFNIVNFATLVINNYNFGENEALLYVGEGEGDLIHQPIAASSFSSQADETASKCSQSENYTLCRGEDPVADLMREVLPLWAAKGRADAKHIVVYSRRVPTTYAAQRVATTLKSYAKRVRVSVYYSEDGGEEGGLIQDRVDHLRKANILMQRI